MEKKLKSRRTVFKLSLSLGLSFFERVKDALQLLRDDVNSVFTFESMNYVFLGILNSVKNCFGSYAGSSTLCTREKRSVTVPRTFGSLQKRYAVCMQRIDQIH